VTAPFDKLRVNGCGAGFAFGGAFACGGTSLLVVASPLVNKDPFGLSLSKPHC
jgi:hypothetical protein